jgi:biopolymer transport protein ExbD
MNRNTFLDSDDYEQTMDVSSLIDICFLLLIYFLVTSTIVPREFDLGMESASERQNKIVAKLDPFLIRIHGSGEIFTGSELAMLLMDRDPDTRELPLLSGHLELFAGASRAAGTTPLVRIQADDDSSHQRVIDVLNSLSAVGIQGVAFCDPEP